MENYTDILQYLYIAGWIVSILASIISVTFSVVWLLLWLKVVVPTYQALKDAAEVYVLEGQAVDTLMEILEAHKETDDVLGQRGRVVIKAIDESDFLPSRPKSVFPPHD